MRKQEYQILGYIIVLLFSYGCLFGQDESVSLKKQAAYYMDVNYAVDDVAKGLKNKVDSLEKKKNVNLMIMPQILAGGGVFEDIQEYWALLEDAWDPNLPKIKIFVGFMTEWEGETTKNHSALLNLEVDKAISNSVLSQGKQDSIIAQVNYKFYGQHNTIKEIPLLKSVDSLLNRLMEVLPDSAQYHPPLCKPEAITKAAEKGVEYANDFTGNSSTAGCNICTRSAIYISTGEGNKDMFPKTGSHIGDTKSPYLYKFQ